MLQHIIQSIFDDLPINRSLLDIFLSSIHQDVDWLFHGIGGRLENGVERFGGVADLCLVLLFSFLDFFVMFGFGPVI